MARPGPNEPVDTERERLIFGAGFAFGVMFTMLILGVVVSTVVPGPVTPSALLDSTVLLPILTAILFAGIVGMALYLLALPEGGIDLPSSPRIEDPDGDLRDFETK